MPSAPRKDYNGFYIYDYIDARSKLIEEEIARDDSLYPNRTCSILSGNEYEDFPARPDFRIGFTGRGTIDEMINLQKYMPLPCPEVRKYTSPGFHSEVLR